MAERIAISRLVVGHGDARRVILPGESFRTESVGISDDDLKAYDVQVPPVMRRPAPTPRAVVADEPVVENRSTMTTEEEVAVGAAVPARGRRRGSELEEL